MYGMSFNINFKGKTPKQARLDAVTKTATLFG